MYNYGYIPNPQATAKYVKSLGNAYASDVAQVVATDDGRDTFLWRAVVYLLQKCTSEVQKRWLYVNDANLLCLRSYNQGSVGSCVGNAEAECQSLELAVNIVTGKAPMIFSCMASAEACYALSREAGGMLGRGDGSYGSAAAKSSTKMGTLWQQPYSNVDLSEYSVARCRQWGNTGVPADLKPIAAQTKMQSSYLIKSVEEAWALIGAGHPINQCSNLGFSTTRDSDGACRQQGSWAHSMALIGRRTTASGRRLFICMNSWGEDWVRGPTYKDQPQGSFGIDYDVVARAIAQGDTFVKAYMDGIKRLKLDWSNV